MWRATRADKGNVHKWRPIFEKVGCPTWPQKSDLKIVGQGMAEKRHLWTFTKLWTKSSWSWHTGFAKFTASMQLLHTTIAFVDSWLGFSEVYHVCALTYLLLPSFHLYFFFCYILLFCVNALAKSRICSSSQKLVHWRLWVVAKKRKRIGGWCLKISPFAPTIALTVH